MITSKRCDTKKHPFITVIAAWAYSVTSWNNAQSKVDLESYWSYDIYLSYANDSGVSWSGICYTWWTGDYLYFASAKMNEHYTENFTPTNRQRSTSGHELGHALGLGHSEYDNSVRWGTYGIYYPQQDDINGIYAILRMVRQNGGQNAY